MDIRFSAKCRLKNKSDIQAVYARRDIYRGKRLVFFRAKSKGLPEEENLSPLSRFCVVASKKCGNAAKRNRIKRLLRDILRKNLFRVGTGFDYIIQARPETIEDKVKQDDFLADFEAYFDWN
ncbi:MAG: ribonuclease P protein component [candidate division Zixibacteria bacterium]